MEECCFSASQWVFFMLFKLHKWCQSITVLAQVQKIMATPSFVLSSLFLLNRMLMLIAIVTFCQILQSLQLVCAIFFLVEFLEEYPPQRIFIQLSTCHPLIQLPCSSYVCKSCFFISFKNIFLFSLICPGPSLTVVFSAWHWRTCSVATQCCVFTSFYKLGTLCPSLLGFYNLVLLPTYPVLFL